MISFTLCLYLAVVLAVVSRGWSQFEDESSMDGYSGGGVDPYLDGYGGEGYGDEGKELAVKLASLEEVDKFIQAAEMEASVVGFFDSASDEEDLEVFQEIAARQGKVLRFAYVTEKSVLESKKYSSTALFVYPPRKFVSEKVERGRYRCPYPKISKNIEGVERFLITKSLPLVGQLNAQSEARYNAVKKPIVVVFSSVDHYRNAKGFAYHANRLRKVAKDWSQFVFAIADVDEYAQSVEEDYGFEGITSKSTVAGIKDDHTFYALPQPYNTDRLLAFLKDFQDGKLEGRLRKPPSEGSESWDDSAVVTLTSENFKEEVFNGDADVLVDFYAPWCGHCRALKPELIKAADHFKTDKSVKIAAFDATAHSVPQGFSVEGYPSIYYVPRGSHQPQPYEGPREAEAIVSFLEEHRTASVAQDSEL